MPVRPIVFRQNNVYYLFNQGNRRQEIFLDKGDYETFIDMLKKYKGKYRVTLLCYCLLPQCFHMLARQESAVPVSKFIGVLSLAYSMYINNKYALVGSLFQGRFKAHYIDDEDLLLQLSKHIHQLPEKADGYRYSSLSDYSRSGGGFVNTKDIHGIFSSRNPTDRYKSFVERAMNKRELRELTPYIFK